MRKLILLALFSLSLSAESKIALTYLSSESSKGGSFSIDKFEYGLETGLDLEYLNKINVSLRLGRKFTIDEEENFTATPFLILSKSNSIFKAGIGNAFSADISEYVTISMILSGLRTTHNTSQLVFEPILEIAPLKNEHKILLAFRRISEGYNEENVLRVGFSTKL